MSKNEAFVEQPLAHDEVTFDATATALRMAGRPVGENTEGYICEGDENGTVHFSLYFPNAHSVSLNNLSEEIHLEKDKHGMWRGTAHYTIGLQFLFLTVDGHDILTQYLPVGFLFSRLINYVEIPPTSPETCFYAFRHGIAHGSVIHDYYMSTFTERAERLTIYIPASYHLPINSSRRYPVLYLQHGHGENELAWVHLGKINLIVDNLIVDNKAEEMIIVMANGMLRKNDVMRYTYFCDDLVNDIIPYIDDRYRTKADKNNRAIAGLSMGSLQSSRLIIMHPELFTSAGIFSGFVQKPRESLLGDDDHISRLKENAVMFNANVHLFFRCMGSNDPWMACFENDDELLESISVNSVRKIYDGKHVWGVWRQAAYDFLQLLFKQENKFKV